MAGASTSVLLAWWICLNGTNRFFRVPMAWQWPERFGWYEEMRGDIGVGVTSTEMPVASNASVRIRRGAPNIRVDRLMQDQTAASMQVPVTALDSVPPWAETFVARHTRDLGEEARAYLVVQAIGWPAHCMKMWRAEVADGGASTASFGGVLTLPKAVKHILPNCATEVLPIVPMPGGLLLCTLFWTVPWLLGVSALAEVRRWRRRRAGRCAACGYRLAGLVLGAPCPECGTPSTRVHDPAS